MTETMWRCDQVRAGQLYNRMMFDTREEAEQFVQRMQQMGDGVAPHVCLAPPVIDTNPSCAPPTYPGSEVNLSWLRAFDMKFTWTHSFHERVSIQPSVGFYNIFNFANFDLPSATLNGLLTGSGGAINGTTPTDHNIDRVGVGTGVYGLGSPRQVEFGLQVSF